MTENKTHVQLPGVTIYNVDNRQQAITDSKGGFSIAGKVNDRLVFAAPGYISDTVLVTTNRFMDVFIDPVNHSLKEVTINGRSEANKQAYTLPYDKDFHGQTLQYQMDDTLGYKGGITIRIWTSQSGKRKRLKEERLIYTENAAIAISRVFSNANVAKYIPLKGNQLSGFIMRYTPGVKTFTSASFLLADYLNNCYKEFRQLSLEEQERVSIFN